jgi:hypothetical protein
MSKDRRAADHAKNPWHSGRLSRARAEISDATDARYGVSKPDVIGDFLRERALDDLFDDGARDDRAADDRAGDDREGDDQEGGGLARSDEPPTI